MFTIVKILYTACKQSGGTCGLPVHRYSWAQWLISIVIPTGATPKKAQISDTGRLFGLIESNSINLTLIELKKLFIRDIEVKLPNLISTFHYLMNF